MKDLREFVERFLILARHPQFIRFVTNIAILASLIPIIFVLLSEQDGLQTVLEVIRTEAPPAITASIAALAAFALIHFFRSIIVAASKFVEIDMLDRSTDFDDQIQQLTDRIDNIENRPYDEQAPLSGLVATRIFSLTADELQNLLQRKLIERYGSDPVSRQFDTLIQQIGFVRDRETVKTNFNLVFGLLFASGSIGVLVWALNGITSGGSALPRESIWLTVIAKSSISILAAIVSLFFLQLYRNGVNHRQYYQNEITNLVLRKVAVMLAHTSENSKNIDRVIKSLALSERNFILRKGETSKQPETSTDLASKCLDALNAALKK
ncbi:MAG: hypothetical protein EP340_01220 [Alphaproteobacteria bacterium]|nr:MAG: hypothetical protein EP340_01220 [Alphaproteobacteria bacterium]